MIAANYKWRIGPGPPNLFGRTFWEATVSRTFAVPWIVPALLLFGTAPLGAGIHQAWDEAHFAKRQTIEQIDQILQDIHQRSGKDLMIETFASIPDDLKPNLQKEGKDPFYTKWARTEAYELGVNGVIILITGDPAHLQIEVGNDTQLRAFTIADRDELVKKLAESFGAKDFDGGLLMAAQFVRDRMARNLAGSAPPTTRTAPASQPNEAARADPNAPDTPTSGRSSAKEP
jgi:uncharacterized membrane protein YgcG